MKRDKTEQKRQRRREVLDGTGWIPFDQWARERRRRREAPKPWR